MVMIEAMACGTPVVALRGGAVSEVLDEGVTGIVCDDPAKLPDALRRVGALDPAACRRRVAEQFGIDKLAEGYEQTYRKAMTHRVAQAVLLSQPLMKMRGENSDLSAHLNQRYNRTPRAARPMTTRMLPDDATLSAGGAE
jgi:hypothetical protein